MSTSVAKVNLRVGFAASTSGIVRDKLRNEVARYLGQGFRMVELEYQP